MAAPAHRPDVAAILSRLRALGSARGVASMARTGITGDGVMGAPMAAVRAEVRRHGTDHALALALWATGCHEARLVAAHAADPARMTRTTLDAWVRAFDNWALCDGVALHLFVRIPGIRAHLPRWAARPGEFERRAAAATIACLAVHETATDAERAADFPLLRDLALDPRPYVKKGVSWALRNVGGRSRTLHAAALAEADAIAARGTPVARWIARDVRRDLERPVVLARIARREAPAPRRASRR
jgi:3-methyladenine DNA glycosylase AlkD